jgi:hypothetical protein
MTITPKSIKILWSNAAGRCSFSFCQEILSNSEAVDLTPYTLGEMAHICGDRPGSNRHDPSQTPQERDDYKNLILLCPNHHRLIDRVENLERFSAAVLIKMKFEHEESVRLRLSQGPYKTKSSIARDILPLLIANHQAWLSYGPSSDFARKNPSNLSAHAVWLLERLKTIIPNNRRISDTLNENVHCFSDAEQEVIAAFQLHARSYELWVQDQISYEGVVRFPSAFTDFIKETLNASK